MPMLDWMITCEAGLVAVEVSHCGKLEKTSGVDTNSMLFHGLIIELKTYEIGPMNIVAVGKTRIANVTGVRHHLYEILNGNCSTSRSESSFVSMADFPFEGRLLRYFISST